MNNVAVDAFADYGGTLLPKKVSPAQFQNRADTAHVCQLGLACAPKRLDAAHFDEQFNVYRFDSRVRPFDYEDAFADAVRGLFVIRTNCHS